MAREINSVIAAQEAARKNAPKYEPMTDGVKITEWVPVLAAEYKVPAPLIHMKAQQIARAERIQWHLTMSEEDTKTIIAGVRREITHAIKSTRK